MLITGKEINEKYVTPSMFTKVNQVGVDLSVSKIEKIKGGVVVLQDKTIVKPESYENVETIVVGDKHMWVLEPGSYAITFNEGIKIPSNLTGFMLQRSSLMRGGATIVSSVWDSGFETAFMGTTMIVNTPITIELNARIAQFFMHENHEPHELYSGQWQGKTNHN